MIPATIKIKMASERRRPSSETGIYLRRHKHEWREIGTYKWPSGDVVPTWRCRVCGDVICCRAASSPSSIGENQ